jgi:hypothetical protein
VPPAETVAAFEEPVRARADRLLVLEVLGLPAAPDSASPKRQFIVVPGLTQTGKVVLQDWNEVRDELIGKPFAVPYERVKALLADSVWRNTLEQVKNLEARIGKRNRLPGLQH